MTPYRIVEHFDVVEYVLSRLFPIFVGFSLDPFPFQQLEKAFSNGVVVAIASPAHAACKIVGLQELLPITTGVLAPLIKVDYNLVLLFAAPDGHQ